MYTYIKCLYTTHVYIQKVFIHYTCIHTDSLSRSVLASVSIILVTNVILHFLNCGTLGSLSTFSQNAVRPTAFCPDQSASVSKLISTETNRHNTCMYTGKARS